MKKFILSAFVLAAFIIAGFGVSAEESNTFVKFIEDTNPTNPVNPEDPNEPGTEPGTGTPGPLSIDYVPTLDFGTQTLTSKIETYGLLNKTPFVQVTDKRGTGEGYKVSAELSAYAASDNATKTLPGAKIDFKNTDFATTSNNNSDAPTGPSNFTLTAAGSAVEIINAGSDQGMGTWVQRWLSQEEPNNNVQLTVNTSTAYKAAYEGKITWTLQQTP